MGAVLPPGLTRLAPGASGCLVTDPSAGREADVARQLLVEVT